MHLLEGETEEAIGSPGTYAQYQNNSGAQP